MDHPALPDDFSDTLDRLDRLSRDHEIMYRLGVGGLILTDLPANEAAGTAAILIGEEAQTARSQSLARTLQMS